MAGVNVNTQLPPQEEVEGELPEAEGGSGDTAAADGAPFGLLDAAKEQLAAEYESGGQAIADEEQAGIGIAGKAGRAMAAAGTGSFKALFETYDFIAGETEPRNKTKFRKGMERQGEHLDRMSGLNAVSSDVSQFVTGMIGAGKITAPFKLLAKGKTAVTLGKKSKAALEIGKAATVGAIVFDPYEERMSNMIKQLPGMEESYLAYTAADPSDTEAEGRFKSALESIGMDLAIAGAFVGVARAAKLFKAGDKEGADKIMEEVADAVPGFDDGGGTSTEISGSLTPAPFGRGSLVGEKLPKDPGSTSMDISGQVQPSEFGRSNTVVPKVPATGAEISGKLEPSEFGRSLTVRVPAEQPRAGDLWTSGGIDVEARFGFKPKAERAGPTSTSGKATANGSALPGDVPIDVPPGAAAISPPGPAAAAPAPGAVPVKQAGQLAAGKQAAAPGADIKFTASDVKEVIGLHEADMGAIMRHGSREAAEEAGYRFAPSSVPWARINGSADLQMFIDDVALTKAEEFANIKGGVKVTDLQVQAQVLQLARVFNQDPAEIMGLIRRMGADAPKTMATAEAAGAVSTKILDDAYQLTRMIAAGTAGDKKAATLKLKRLLGMGSEAGAYATSILSNAARTTRRARFGVKQEVFDALEAMDPDDLVQAMLKTKGNPKLLQAAANPGFWARFRSGVGKTTQHLIVNNLLWGYPTHVFNISSNTVMMGLRPTEKLIGSLFIRGASGSAIRDQAKHELRYTTLKIMDSFESAADAFKSGDSRLNPHDTEGYLGVGVAGQKMEFPPVRGIEDLVGYAQLASGMPTRLLGAQDELFKNIRYRAVVQAKAAVEAEKMGLTGQDFQFFVERRLDEAFDDAGAALDDQALLEARVSTFTDDLTSTAGKSVQNAVASMPYLRFIVPFVRTPLKALGYGVRNSPGLNMLHSKYRNDFFGKNGPEAQAQAYGQMAIGTTAFAAATALTANGVITGGGPSEPAQREWLTSQGWKPYSIKHVNADGSISYIPYSRTDAVGMVMGIAADITDGLQHPDRYEDGWDVAQGAVMSIAKNATNRTFLLSLQNFMRFATDPDKETAKYIGNQGEVLIPFSSLLKQLNQDPYLRETRTLADHMMDRMPGSSKLPPRYDILSEPMLVHKSVWSTREEVGLVDEEMERLMSETGKLISKPSPEFRGIDMRDVVLADGRTAFQALNEGIQKAGLRKKLLTLMRTDAYRNAYDGKDPTAKGTKLGMLSQTVTAFRGAVRDSMLAQHPELRSAVLTENKKNRGVDVLDKHRKMDEAAIAEAGKIPMPRNAGEAAKALEGLGIKVNN